MKVSKTTMEERLLASASNEQQIAEIKQKCSMSDIKEIVANAGLRIAKKFLDEKHPELIEKYSRISMGTVAVLARYLQEQEVVRKKNVMDASSYLTDTIKSVTVGNNEIIYHGNKENVIKCENAVMGGVDANYAAACTVAASVRYQEKKQTHRVLTFHKDNQYAPGAGLTKFLSGAAQLKAPIAHEIVEEAMIINDLSEKAYNELVYNINIAAPRVIVTEKVEGEEVKKLKPVVEYRTIKGARKFEFRKPGGGKMAVSGEYADVASNYNIFQMGTKYPSIKRVGKNFWTGTPIDTMSVDHVIALHDARIPVDSTILVVTAESNLITLLRSNFGANVYGIGRGPGLILESTVNNYKFDYVYYPKPIYFNPSGKFDKSCNEFLDAIKRNTRIWATGRVICHLSPLFLYCKEFCDALNIEVLDSNDTKIYTLERVKGEEEPKKYAPSKTVNFPVNKPEKLGHDTEVKKAEFFTTYPTIYHKFAQIDAHTFKQLTWGALARTEVPMALTQMSYSGTMLFGGNIKPSPVSTVLGKVICHMRDVFKSIWVTTSATKNTYNIRRMLKGAVVSDLNWQDEWSALYMKDIRVDLEEESHRGVSNAEKEAEQEEADPNVIQCGGHVPPSWDEDDDEDRSQ